MDFLPGRDSEWGTRKEWAVFLVVSAIILGIILAWTWSSGGFPCWGSQCYNGGTVTIPGPPSPPYQPNDPQPRPTP